MSSLYDQVVLRKTNFFNMLKDRADNYWLENYDKLVQNAREEKSYGFEIEILDQPDDPLKIYKNYVLNRAQTLFPNPFFVYLSSNCDCECGSEHKTILFIRWGRGCGVKPSGVPLFDELMSNFEENLKQMYKEQPKTTLDDFFLKFNKELLTEKAFEASKVGQSEMCIGFVCEHRDEIHGYLQSIFPDPFVIKWIAKDCIKIIWK